MFRKRTPVATTTYLGALSKSIRSGTSSNFNALYFARSSNTATERFDFLDQHHGDNPVDYEQKVDWFRVANPNRNGFQHNHVGHSQEQRYRGNIEGFERNPRINSPQSPPSKDLNFPGGYGGESNRNEFPGNSVQERGSLYSKSDVHLNSVFQNGNSGDSYRRTSSGYNSESSRNPNGSYREVQPAVQQNHNGVHGLTPGFPKGVNGSYEGSVGQFQPPGYPGISQHKPNDYVEGSREINESMNGYNRVRSALGMPNNSIPGNTGRIQQSPDNYYPASTSTPQPDGDNWGKNRTRLQSPNAGKPYLENSGIPRHNTNDAYEEGSGITQQSPGNYLGGSHEIKMSGYDKVRTILRMKKKPNYYSESTSTSQSDADNWGKNSTRLQSSNAGNPYLENGGIPQRSTHNAYEESSGITQQSPGNYLGGSHEIDNKMYQQSVSGYDKVRSPLGMQKPNNYLTGNTRKIQQSPDSYYSANTSMLQSDAGNWGKNRTPLQSPNAGNPYLEDSGIHWHSTNNAYKEGSGITQQSPGNYLGGSHEIDDRMYQQSVSGYDRVRMQKPNNYLTGNTRKIQQSPDNYYSANTSMLQSDADNWGKNRTHLQSSNAGNPYSENSGIPQRSTNSAYEESSGITLQSPGNYLGGSHESNERMYQQGVSGYDRVRSAPGMQNKPNNFLTGNTRKMQHSPDNYYSGSTSTSQSDADNWGKNRTRLQNSNADNPYSENSGIPQLSTHNAYEESSGITQQSSGNYLGGSHETGNRMYQQNVNGHNGIPSAFAMQSSGEIGHNHNGSSYNGNFQNTSNHRTAAMDSEVSDDSIIHMKPVEVTADQYRSTVDNLDDFFMEGRLTEKVLELLESPNIPADLPQHYILIKACEKAKTREEAKDVHEHIMRVVSSPDVAIYNKILDMYGRCSSMVDAFAVFDTMPHHNLTSWDTMITWLAKCGHGEDAVELFTQFKESGLKPDGSMFVGVFSACGVLEDMFEGMLHFESMSKNHGIVPSMEHYVSVVDMLGTSGYLDEAVEFIEKMPVEPSVDIWEALMNLARVHGNVDLGDRCAEIIELIEPARLSEQSKAGLIPAKASDIAKEKEKKKLASQNLLAIRSKINEYRAGDTSDPDNDRIYGLLRGMKQQMKEVGYVPETRVVLHDIDPESKEEALLSHSERLALANGLLNSPARAQIRIIKNLRVCVDCHSALKIISKLVGREIVARDAKRFHHFRDGLCSCRDYW